MDIRKGVCLGSFICLAAQADVSVCRLVLLGGHIF